MPNRFWSTHAMRLAQRSELAGRYDRRDNQSREPSPARLKIVSETGSFGPTGRSTRSPHPSWKSNLAPAPEPQAAPTVDWAPRSLQHLRAAPLLVQKGLLTSRHLAAALADQLL